MKIELIILKLMILNNHVIVLSTELHSPGIRIILLGVLKVLVANVVFVIQEIVM